MFKRLPKIIMNSLPMEEEEKEDQEGSHMNGERQ
jgi:hypothetical protein